MNTSVNTDIRKKAKKGIDRADDTTVKMILAMLEVQEKAREEETQEILRRFEDYEQGRITPLTHTEFESKIKAISKNKNASTRKKNSKFVQSIAL